MGRFKIVAVETLDPEIRLEQASLIKAMYDADLDVTPVTTSYKPKPNDILFGAPPFHQEIKCTGRIDRKTWELPGFRDHMSRSFKVCTLEEAEEEVQRLSAQGKDHFIKSIEDKLLTAPGKAGTSLNETLGDMFYSFIDRDGAVLLVQERVDMTHEYRCAVVDGKVVTSSPCHYAASPLGLLQFAQKGIDAADVFYPRMPAQISEFVHDPELAKRMLAVASEIAEKSNLISGTIDLCLIGGDKDRIELIEINAGWPGKYGLYFCDPTKIAAAMPSMLERANALYVAIEEDAGVRREQALDEGLVGASDDGSRVPHISEFDLDFED